MYRKKTLRNMAPVTRRYARILNDLAGILRQLKNLTEDIDRIELDSTAFHNRQKHEEAHQKSDEAELANRIDAAEIFYDPALKDVEPEVLPGRIHWEKAGEDDEPTHE